MIGPYQNDEILVFGKKGWLGRKIYDYLECNAAVDDGNIETVAQIVEEIEFHQAKVIINATGVTGSPNTDWCEEHLEETFNANTWVPLLMVEAARKTGARILTLGSGCELEFDYELDEPITEDKPPNYFKLAYSRSKAAAEAMLEYYAREPGTNITVCRIRIPLDVYPSDKNLLTKLIKYGRVFRERNSITYVPDFLKMVKFLIANELNGIFNTVCDGGADYQKFMEEWKRQGHPDFQYEVINASDYPKPRTNLLLSTEKLKRVGFPVRNINDVMEECVREYIKNGG